jgi:hypothetical protein
MSTSQIREVVSQANTENLAGRISGTSVAGILKMFGRGSEPTDEALQIVAEHATNQDLAAASALKRCAVVGVPANECL